jgi:redox-sensitive bicupin YhaK (pirin superfamily)
MIDIRPFNSLGHADHGWLNARHHFSFANYHDPSRMGWGRIRVWNDDQIAAKSGFPPHPHRDMEIVTYVRTGAITHQDSMGNKGRTGAGDVQVMSAGTGIRHSETNPSPHEDVHFIQMWVPPSTEGLAPGYEQRDINAELDKGGLRAIASGQGHAGAIAINQRDAVLWGGRLRPDEKVTVPEGHNAHVFVAIGAVELEGAGKLSEGDAARLVDAGTPALTAGPDGAEVLIWVTA